MPSSLWPALVKLWAIVQKAGSGLGRLISTGERHSSDQDITSQGDVTATQFHVEGDFNVDKVIQVTLPGGEPFYSAIERIPDQIVERLGHQIAANLKGAEGLLPFSLKKDTYLPEMKEFDEYFEASEEQLKRACKALPPKYAAMLSAAYHIDHLYSSGDNVRANRTKSDLGKHFGWEGRRLCNLVGEGYILSLLEEFFFDVPETPEEKIRRSSEFLSRLVEVIENRNIHFVSAGTDSDEVVRRVGITLRGGKQSAVIHAVGEHNIAKAEKIMRRIIHPAHFHSLYMRRIEEGGTDEKPSFRIEYLVK